MALIPLLYYAYAASLAAYLHLTPAWLVTIIVLVIVAFEILRLHFGWMIFGLRQHEAKQPASFAWGALAIGVVLILSPGREFAIPIIWACAFGDPFIGELRACQCPRYWVFVLGVLLVIAVWLIAFMWLGTPWWWALIMGPVTVIAESIYIKWVDDNALMMLVPLVLILITQLLIL